MQAAPIRDGLVSHVTVTDRHHPLCGQLLPLVLLHSARGPAYIVVALPDGRRRSLRRASTDLAGTAEAPLYDGPRISVGTLLPLARHIVACLYARAPRGERARGSAPCGHWRRLTVLGALSGEGMAAAMSMSGS